MPKSVSVLGSGSWGTALALLLARNGHQVTLWGRDAGQIAAMRRDGGNLRYLPEAAFPGNLAVTADLDGAAEGRAAIVVAVLLAVGASFVLEHFQETTMMAFTTTATRLDAEN